MYSKNGTPSRIDGTYKYLLMFLALAIIGFIVALVGLLVMILSPLLPLFEKEISLLKDKEWMKL